MKTILVTLSFFLFHICYVTGQEMTYNPHLKEGNACISESDCFVFEAPAYAINLYDDIQAVDKSLYRNHYLGDEVAKRLYLFEKQYVHHTEPPPGAFSGKKIVQKPLIYNSIYQLEKYYKKQVRKNRMNKEEAVISLCHYLEISLLLFYRKTDEFELVLEKSAKEEDIIAVFDKVKIK
jgi:hypothetical protein